MGLCGICNLLLVSVLPAPVGLAQAADWGQQVDEAKKIANAGRFEDARRLLLGLLRETADLSGMRAAIIQQEIGVVDEGLGRYAEAERSFRDAIRILDRIEGPQSEQAIVARENLATMYIELGRPEQAEPLLKSVLEARRKSAEAQPISLAEAYDDMANLHSLQHRRDAVSYYQQALDIFRRAGAERTISFAMTLNHLATDLIGRGRHREALPLAQRSFDLLQQLPSATADARFAGLALLGAAETESDPAAAAVHLVGLLSMAESLYGPEHPRTAMALHLYAQLLRRQHRSAEAKPYEEREAQVLAATRANQNTVHVDALGARPRLRPRR